MRVALVIHGLDTHSDPQAVLDEVQELGFPMVAASRLHSMAEPQKPLPLVQLLVEKGEKVNELLDLKRFLGS